GVILKIGISPSVGVWKSLAVLLDELKRMQGTGYRVRRAGGKGGVGKFFRLPLDLRNLGAVGERLAIARSTFLVRLDHHGIRNDYSNHVLGVGQTRANHLPGFVSFELREGQPTRNFYSVLVLLCRQADTNQTREHGAHKQSGPDDLIVL